MNKVILILSCFVFLFGHSQNLYNLHLVPKVQGSQLFMNEQVTVNGIKVNFDHFNYYLSNLHVFYDGNQDLDLSDTVFLIKSDDFVLNLGDLAIQNVEKISFGVGVQYELNHLDISMYNESHPLSFQTPSMHWGWASGYMHMVIGGTADSNLDEIPDAYFELHNLGDNNYYIIEVVINEVNTSGNQKDIFIDCNVDAWLTLIDLGINGIKHGENGVNYKVMKNITVEQVFTNPLLTTIVEKTNFEGEIFSSISYSGFELNWKNFSNLENIELIDINGKIITSKNQLGNQGLMNFENLHQGIYFARFYSKENKILNQFKINYSK